MIGQLDKKERYKYFFCGRPNFLGTFLAYVYLVIFAKENQLQFLDDHLEEPEVMNLVLVQF